jgi:hypothetical protein
MRGRLHGERCSAPSWPTLHTSKGLVHSQPTTQPGPPTQPGPEPQPQPFVAPVYRTPGPEQFGLDCHDHHRRRDAFGVGAELIWIILLLTGGIIYAILASTSMSFDDLIELRFLPSRRRHRDAEYFEQLRSMTLPREVSYRVTDDESVPPHNTFESRGVDKEEFAHHHHPGA